MVPTTTSQMKIFCKYATHLAASPFRAFAALSVSTKRLGVSGRSSVSAMLLAFGLTASLEASAVVVFTETFNTDTATTAATLAQYTDFMFSNAGSTPAIVSGGVLNIGPRTADTTAGVPQVFDVGGFAGDLTITADLTNMPGGGFYHVGLSVGANQILFHPGFTGISGNIVNFPPGAFRVDGPDGFPNRNMGFVPSTSFHQMVVTIAAATGNATVKITDSANSNVYMDSFQLSDYSAFDRIGFQTGGGVNAGISKYDNLVIESTVPLPMPEPGTLAILGVGLAGLGVARRRKAAA